MAAVVDIRCPDCGEYDAVRKVAVGRYRCEACGNEFTPEDVLAAVGEGGDGSGGATGPGPGDSGPADGSHDPADG